MDHKVSLLVCCRLLKLYKIADNATPREVRNYKHYKSQLYGMANVYSFEYHGKQYYVSDDYSLMDNPQYVKNILVDVEPALTGQILKNPVTQTDGAVYAGGLDGTEYYLWQSL